MGRTDVGGGPGRHGRRGFPTHKKYQGPPVDTVLVNGCECEPYLTCDHRIMLERTERVIEGALALGRPRGSAGAVS